MDPALFAEALGDGQFGIDLSIGWHALRYVRSDVRRACPPVSVHIGMSFS